MEWAYSKYGDVLSDDIKSHEKEILEWCEKQELNLKAKQKSTLISQALWSKHKKLLDVASLLATKIGDEEFNDFNLFKKEVDKVLKDQKIKLSASEKNIILSAVSWYDETAQKVIKKVHKLTGNKLEEKLKHLRCKEEDLSDFGLYATGKNGEYIEYESDTELRDSENIPLDEDIQEYFLKEVKPHVKEAWINLDSVKIGYEISFNRYFYKHKPLRSIEEVTADIVELEKESEGLIKEILGL
jgi:type I restriction enzyme M protein